MAQRIEIFNVQCAANVTQANALEKTLAFNPGIVERVEITIPFGHAFLTGIALANAHQIVIPSSGTTWLIGDDDRYNWPLDDYPNTGAWTAFVYNTDPVNIHTWQVHFHINEIILASGAEFPAMIPTDQLVSPVDLTPPVNTAPPTEAQPQPTGGPGAIDGGIQMGLSEEAPPQ